MFTLIKIVNFWFDIVPTFLVKEDYIDNDIEALACFNKNYCYGIITEMSTLMISPSSNERLASKGEFFV